MRVRHWQRPARRGRGHLLRRDGFDDIACLEAAEAGTSMAHFLSWCLQPYCGSFPYSLKGNVVTPVPDGVMLELSIPMMEYWLVFSLFTSRKTLAR